MRFSVEWLDGAPNACAEERATLCRLRIFVGDENACVFYDPRTDEKYDHVVVPAVHLAEGIATEWWSIFGGRDREHSLLPYRTGFALPNVLFKFDGAVFEVIGAQLDCDNPKLRFWQTCTEALSREVAESVLSEFVEQVVDKLADEGVASSEVALCWSRVSLSWKDPDERAFCEAAGAMGVDPYEITDTDASLIEAAGDWFTDGALIEFLAGVDKWSHADPWRVGSRDSPGAAVLESIQAAESRPSYKSRLPELHGVARQVAGVTKRAPGERIWAPSYRAARAFRDAIGIPRGKSPASTRVLATKLGAKRFAPAVGLSGVAAVVSREKEDVRIHLRGCSGRQWDPWAANFAFARALGDAVCFPDARRSVVNELHGAERQAAGRAFAAEFLAPVDKVLDMLDGGLDIDEISGSLNVSSQVVAHQIENQERIRQACDTFAYARVRRERRRVTRNVPGRSALVDRGILRDGDGHMPLDLRKIRAKKRGPKPTDPLDIFRGLSVADQNINDLWLAQGDALRDWHENRGLTDVGVVLNTGAGKTLVGLLIAQSLVNETRGKVLYACSSIQLVEQTEEKAAGYGLDVTTYFRREFSNDRFHRGEAACVTTYQALFNGKSRFPREEPTAVVFDDAHAAEHLLRDAFSLQIERNRFPDLYSQIVSLFQPYHQRIGRATSYGELKSGNSGGLFLVPPFEVGANVAEFRRVLHMGKFGETVETMFAWEYIRDRVDISCVLITDTGLTITPAFLPTRDLYYFRQGIRRIYLSATLTAPDAFARTFGRIPDRVIAPSTSAGECERLILVPAMLDSDSKDVDLAARLVETKKTLILVPGYGRAKRWRAVASPPDVEAVTEAVREFRTHSDDSKLILAARYDGVDLPGDTCRLMVVDDLPTGTGPLERFLWERLNLSNTLRTLVASRIVQSFGRISRGLSDHGVIVLTGKRLIEWLTIPKNLSTLPAFLQKQLQLGQEVSEDSETIEDLFVARDACLDRNKDWIETYGEFMREAEAEPEPQNSGVLAELALSESEFGLRMWRRDYDGAVRALRKTLEKAYELSPSTGAWHSLWLGWAFSLGGDDESARAQYTRAHSTQRNIPQLPREGVGQPDEVVPDQVKAVAEQMTESPDGSVNVPSRMLQDLAPLDGSGTVRETEEAVRALGQYLGARSSRPDNDHGTGPDVLWEIEGDTAICMELKTQKQDTSQYKKGDIGQLSDHVQWVKDHTTAETIKPVFIGPHLPVSGRANPASEMVVAELSELKSLGDRLISAVTDVSSTALPIMLRADLADMFGKRELLFPDVMDSIKYKRLAD